jgi:hypothetical protein
MYIYIYIYIYMKSAEDGSKDGRIRTSECSKGGRKCLWELKEGKKERRKEGRKEGKRKEGREVGQPTHGYNSPATQLQPAPSSSYAPPPLPPAPALRNAI